MITDSIALKVFISYSHDSQIHKDRVLALCDRLRDDGIDCNIDQYEPSPLEGWQRWMLTEIEAADLVLIVCSEPYNRRFRGQEETGKGKGAIWEGGVIIQELYDTPKKLFTDALKNGFLPILVNGEDLKDSGFYKYIPQIIKEIYDISISFDNFREQSNLVCIVDDIS
jgi:hypothetical protein